MVKRPACTTRTTSRSYAFGGSATGWPSRSSSRSGGISRKGPNSYSCWPVTDMMISDLPNVHCDVDWLTGATSTAQLFQGRQSQPLTWRRRAPGPVRNGRSERVGRSLRSRCSPVNAPATSSPSKRAGISPPIAVVAIVPLEFRKKTPIVPELRQLPARLRRAVRPWVQDRVDGGLVDERSVRRIAADGQTVMASRSGRALGQAPGAIRGGHARNGTG